MRDWRRAGVAAALAAAIPLAGCASVRLHPDDQPGGSLETYIGTVRAVSAAARPIHTGGAAAAAEAWDARLAGALRDLAGADTADGQRRVGDAYRALGILDLAYRHLRAAVRLDPQDAASFDALARLWRDWGMPALGMADAYRAVRLAPASPVPVNTFGTLLAAEGRMREAREWYARALLLDPQASYALTNLCYADTLLSRPGALVACRRAAALQGGSAAAHNNLALAYAAQGDLEKARAEFAVHSEPGAAEFNMGIVYMARRQFGKAASSFAAAERARPPFAMAAARARQARTALAAPGGLGARR